MSKCNHTNCKLVIESRTGLVIVITPPTICGKQEVGWVGPFEPPDLVDLLLDLQRLQVVEFWLVTLEGAIHIVLPTTLQPVKWSLKVNVKVS